MNKNKYYKIVKRENVSNEVMFVVMGCESWMGKMFSCWSEYAKEHKSLDSAKKHVEFLSKHRVLKEKTILKFKAFKYEVDK